MVRSRHIQVGSSMRAPLTLFTLTVLAFDFTFSNPDSDRDKNAVDNPWESLYPETHVGNREKRDLSLHDSWGEGRGMESPGYEQSGSETNMRDYPSVVMSNGRGGSSADTYDTDHNQRHRSRHGNNNDDNNNNNNNNRRRHERDQEAVSLSPWVTEESTLDSVVTGDPDSQTDTSCLYCGVLEANKQYRLEQIRKEILAKLRLERPPNITDKRLPQIPEINEWLSKLGEESISEPSVTTDPDEPTVRIISMLNLAQPPPPNKVLPNMENVCYFEFQPDVEPSDIISAKLGVFLKPVKYDTNIVTMFLIYKVKPRRRGNVLIKRKRIKLNAEDTNKWYRFNVDSVVKNWVRNSDNNYGLQIMIYDNDGESLAIVEPANSTEKLFKPYIELDIKEKRLQSRREKRMLSLDCTEDSATKSCCRYPMTLDFSGMGWDWVLAPKSVDVNYCAGECNISAMTSPYIHFVNQNSEVIAACCVPKSHSGFKMMYYSGSENQIEFGEVKEIIVESCGCT